MKNIIRMTKILARKLLNLLIRVRDTIISTLNGVTLRQLLPNARFTNPSDCYKNVPHNRIRKIGGIGETGSQTPSVLILIIGKNVERFLPTLENNLQSLSYPKHLISIGMLEGDSTDNTYGQLQKMTERLQQSFHKVELHKKDFRSVANTNHKRWKVKTQLMRRTIIAKARNHLLKLCLKDEHQWVLWIDADVMSWDKDVIEQLLSFNKGIVAPHCVREDGKTFDLNSFKYKQDKKKNWRSYIKDGLLQPPRSFGRLYLSDLQEYDLVSLDGVGGTMLLVNGELHRKGLIYPEDIYHLHIETEALAFMARDMGSECWGAPHVTIVHPSY